MGSLRIAWATRPFEAFWEALEVTLALPMKIFWNASWVPEAAVRTITSIGPLAGLRPRLITRWPRQRLPGVLRDLLGQGDQVGGGIVAEDEADAAVGVPAVEVLGLGEVGVAAEQRPAEAAPEADGQGAVDLGGGNDRFRADAIVSSISVAGGDGNDDLATSGGPDVLAGGPGNDILRGRQGNDLLVGGEGHKTGTGGDTEER